VSRNHDLVWIEYETLPWLPVWIEQFLLPRRVPYVLDYDDAVFHSYDMHRNSWIRKLLGNKHDVLMRGAAIVCVGNEYLAERARQAGAKQVEVIPTVVDLDRYPMLKENQMVRKENGIPCVGWIGQRTTAAFLLPHINLFERLIEEGIARFSAIGIDDSTLGLTMEFIPWGEESEVENIMNFDIGVMPLSDSPFQRGKCGYKLIQYLACGLPVVALHVGLVDR
jgi:glycosyltransferase involved in cell wall biosynthesis